jgi:hypothetical protein
MNGIGIAMAVLIGGAVGLTAMSSEVRFSGLLLIWGAFVGGIVALGIYFTACWLVNA